MPRWVAPDHLTGFGFAGAALAAVGYAASGSRPDFLWLASLGLVINWFGDSLDGTVARLRGIERPRYGYYLDNSIDCVAQLLLAFGIGLSGYVRFDLCLFALVAYLMVSVLSFIRANVSNVFQITYAAVGPTEVRVGFVVLNSQFVVAGMVLRDARHVPGDHGQAGASARDRRAGARKRSGFETGPMARIRGRLARHSPDDCGTRDARAPTSNLQSFGPLLIGSNLSERSIAFRDLPQI
jgi:phosphatidylglycerophosphate synthase